MEREKCVQTYLDRTMPGTITGRNKHDAAHPQLHLRIHGKGSSYNSQYKTCTCTTNTSLALQGECLLCFLELVAVLAMQIQRAGGGRVAFMSPEQW
jgi:hypothetical protein